jgi:hypothetical protein
MPRQPPILHVEFGAGSAIAPVIFDEGWASPEATHRWAMGWSAVLRVRVKHSFPDLTVLMHLCPFRHAPQLPSQVIEVMQDGRVVFSDRISGPAIIAFPVQLDDVASGEFTLEFSFPEHVAPANFGIRDSRPLSFEFHSMWVIAAKAPIQLRPRIPRPAAFEQLASKRNGSVACHPGMAPSDLLQQFESLGHCCDFGLVQRHFGAETLGLLRFAAISTFDLVRGLMNDFHGLGGPGHIVPYIPDGLDEFWIRETEYNLLYHTFKPPGSVAPEQLTHQESRRLPFLKRKMLEDLANGEKIFVLRRPEPLSDYETLAVSTALRLHGRSALLVLEQDAGAEPGTVEVIGPGVIIGHLDGVPGQVPPSHEVWLSICASTYDLTRSWVEDRVP